jgi:hypothetical protein
MADAAPHEFDSRRLQAGQVQLRTAPVQIVQAHHACAWKAVFQMQRQAAADETSAAGDQDAFNRWIHLESIGFTPTGPSRKWILPVLRKHEFSFYRRREAKAATAGAEKTRG